MYSFRKPFQASHIFIWSPQLMKTISHADTLRSITTVRTMTGLVFITNSGTELRSFMNMWSVQGGLAVTRKKYVIRSNFFGYFIQVHYLWVDAVPRCLYQVCAPGHIILQSILYLNSSKEWEQIFSVMQYVMLRCGVNRIVLECMASCALDGSELFTGPK